MQAHEADLEDELKMIYQTKTRRFLTMLSRIHDKVEVLDH